MTSKKIPFVLPDGAHVDGQLMGVESEGSG